MATRKDADTTDSAPPTVSPDGRSVRWVDAHMQTTYANVCNVVGTREEVMLLFGSNQTWHAGQGDVRVILSNRVVLNPFAAKRLQQMLERGLKEYEARYGELKV